MEPKNVTISTFSNGKNHFFASRNCAYRWAPAVFTFFPPGTTTIQKRNWMEGGANKVFMGKEKRRVEIVIYKQNSSLNFLLGSIKRIIIFSINRFTSWFKKFVWLNHAMQLNSETAGLHKEHDKSIFLVTSPPFEALLAQFYKTRVRKIAPEWRGNATCTQEAVSEFHRRS